MIPKYSINFSWKKPGKSPRASGLLDPGFGRAGPRKNGSGGRVLQARPVVRNITSVVYVVSRQIPTCIDILLLLNSQH